MALFEIDGTTLSLVLPKNFSIEKEIQALVEKNLETVFSCRFVASEFPTGAEHAGRIDTLALSEDHNPVIIEYKKIESSELVNQSLYYLSWIRDHRGDFQIAANKTLGPATEVDWSDVRVICIAPGYKKYDLHAVQMMGANIELWQYRLFQNDTLYLEEVFRRTVGLVTNTVDGGKNPVMVAAGKKAAATRAQGMYSFEQHLEKAEGSLIDVAKGIRDFILGLDDSIEESPKKYYVAYKVTQNFACIVVQRRSIVLYLKLNPSEVKNLPSNVKDVRNIGHHGTGDLQVTIRSAAEALAAHDLLRLAFDGTGGS